MSTFLRVSLISILGLALVNCNGVGSSQSTQTASVTRLKLDGVHSLFRTNLNSANASNNSQDLNLTELFGLNSDGSFARQTFIDTHGNEINEVSVLKFKRLSTQYALILLENTHIVTTGKSDQPQSVSVNQSMGLVDLTTGDMISLDPYSYDFDSIVEKQGYLFGFDTTLKTLNRFEIATQQITKYATLPDGETFITGARFDFSPSIFWDDSGNLIQGAGFVDILIDENLNAIAQVNSYQYNSIVVRANGQTYGISDFSPLEMSGNGSEPNSGVFITYSNDGKLLRLYSKSGFYTHLWPSSPTPDNIDMTVSEITFTDSGINATDIFQFKPWVGQTFTGDNTYLRCRQSESIAKNVRQIPFSQGFLSADLSDSSNIRVSYLPASTFLFALLGDSNISSQDCYISNGYIYYLNSAASSIQRISLTQSTVSPVTIAANDNITTFYIVGDKLIYTANDQTYAVDLNTLGQTTIDSSAAALVNDVFEISP